MDWDLNGEKPSRWFLLICGIPSFSIAGGWIYAHAKPEAPKIVSMLRMRTFSYFSSPFVSSMVFSFFSVFAVAFSYPDILITHRDIDEQLFHAIDQSNVRRVEDLLSQGADPDAKIQTNVRDARVGQTLFGYALMHSDPKTISVLEKKRGHKLLSSFDQVMAFESAMNKTVSGNPNYSCDRIQLMFKVGLEANVLHDKSPLMLAVDKDNPDWVQLFLDHGANVNLQASTGETALFFARSSVIAKMLLGKGADAGLEDKHGATALHKAILGNRPSVVAVILQEGGDLSHLKADEALILACRNKPSTKDPKSWDPSSVIIKTLLQHGVDPNVTVELNGWNYMPLLEAVRSKNPNAVNILVQARADPLKVHDGNRTLLEHAIQLEDPEIARILLPKYLPLPAEAKANIRKIVLSHGKPSMIAFLEQQGINFSAGAEQVNQEEMAKGFFSAVQNDNFDKIDILLKQGGNINNASLEETPLTFAIKKSGLENNLRMVKYLLDHGADVNLPQKNGETPLAVVINYGSSDVYFLLRARKSNARAHAPNNLYLNLAVQRFLFSLGEKTRSKEVLKDLIAAGNDTNQVNEFGQTPLMQLACFLKRSYDNTEVEELADVLLSSGAQVDYLPPGCQEGADELKLETRSGWPERGGEFGCHTPLMGAVGSGNRIMVDLLLNAKAKVNYQSRQDGWTALMLAARVGDPQIVSGLLRRGANPHLKNNEGQTAADIAKETGNTKALKQLQ